MLATKFFGKFGCEHTVAVRKRSWVQGGLWTDQSCPLPTLTRSRNSVHVLRSQIATEGERCSFDRALAQFIRFSDRNPFRSRKARVRECTYYVGIVFMTDALPTVNPPFFILDRAGCSLAPSLVEIEPFSITLAQDWLTECDQSRKSPLKYFAMPGNRTRAMERTHSKIHEWLFCIVPQKLVARFCSCKLSDWTQTHPISFLNCSFCQCWPAENNMLYIVTVMNHYFGLINS